MSLVMAVVGTGVDMGGADDLSHYCPTMYRLWRLWKDDPNHTYPTLKLIYDYFQTQFTDDELTNLTWWLNMYVNVKSQSDDCNVR